jgi:hypothetical protein
MKVKVIDSYMGSGKTSFVIQEMNSCPNQKYIYVAPKLTDTANVMKECPS